MTSHRQNQMYKIVWVICLIVTTICAFVAYTSERWLENTTTKAKIGLVKECAGGGGCAKVSLSGAGHWAWEMTIIVFGIMLGLVILGTLGAISTLFIMRDRIIHVTRSLIGVASFCMFIALIFWPIGLDNNRLPCSGTGQMPEVYHLCNPWDVDIAMYIMIVAMIFLTFSVCIGSVITSKVSQRKEQKAKKSLSRKESRAAWYGQTTGAQPPKDSKDGKDNKDKDDKKNEEDKTKKESLLRKKSKKKSVGSVAPVEPRPNSADDGDDYLVIESKGNNGWSETSMMEQQNQIAYLNPMFDDYDEF